MTSPASASDLTTIWLNQVRDIEGHNWPDAASTRVSQIGIGVGFICRVYRIEAEYNSPSGAPSSFVAKLNSIQDQHDRYWATPGLSAYEKEARFYRDVAPIAKLRTPTRYFDQVDRDLKRSVLLLEDLSPMRPGDPVDGCSADDALAAARDWGRFNARFWKSDHLQTIDHLPRFTTGIDSLQKRFDAAWSDYLAQFANETPADILKIGNALTGQGARNVRYKLGESPHTLCHGDFHLDNTFFWEEDGSKRIAVIDWNGLRAGAGMWDLSHLIYQGLEPDIRRACESSLFAVYCPSLAENGVDYSIDDAWRDYRLSLLTHLQKLARGHTMETTADRHFRLRQALRRRTLSAISDHCTTALIPS